jgi:hypothetical protein
LYEGNFATPTEGFFHTTSTKPNPGLLLLFCACCGCCARTLPWFCLCQTRGITRLSRATNQARVQVFPASIETGERGLSGGCLLPVGFDHVITHYQRKDRKMRAMAVMILGVDRRSSFVRPASLVLWRHSHVACRRRMLEILAARMSSDRHKKKASLAPDSFWSYHQEGGNLREGLAR